MEVNSLFGRVDAELDSVGKFGSVASKYMELRKAIEEKYFGEELAEHLKWLDDSYDNAVDAIAFNLEFGIKKSAKIYEMQVRANNELYS